jgi:hypothetical protein
MKTTWLVLINVTAVKFVFFLWVDWGFNRPVSTFSSLLEGKTYKRRNEDIKLQMRWRFPFQKLVRSVFLTIITQKGFKCRNHSSPVLKTLWGGNDCVYPKARIITTTSVLTRWKQLAIRKTSFQPANISTYIAPLCSVTIDVQFFWSIYKQRLSIRLLDY